jgi:hypothetical protein
MKATTLLLFQHRRIQTLVAAAKKRGAYGEHAILLVEAVAEQIAATEGVLYPVVERDLALDVSAHKDAHRRARNALARLATTSGVEFREELARLDLILREHALAESAIVRALEDRMSDGSLIHLGLRMSEFQQGLRRRSAA